MPGAENAAISAWLCANTDLLGLLAGVMNPPGFLPSVSNPEMVALRVECNRKRLHPRFPFWLPGTVQCTPHPASLDSASCNFSRRGRLYLRRVRLSPAPNAET